MEQIPVLVQDFNLRNTTNAVCVAVVKFTLDQYDAAFDPEENPAPPKMARQFASLRTAYGVMNQAYAEQQKRSQTEQIAGLDTEGDQLVYGVKGMLEGAVRMTYDQQRLTLAKTLWEAWRKYRIDPTENMISEWSKIQQFCEEYLGDALLQQAGVALAVDGAIRRLAQIADQIRLLMNQRNAETPEASAMKNAREAVYPEYRAAVLLLNSFAATDDDPERYAAIIRALNDNIDYVRKHAMAKGGGTEPEPDGGSSDDQGGDTPEPEPTPVTPE